MTSQVRTFRAPSVREALEQVKQSLGPDAVILGTRSVASDGLGGLLGATRVEISAAPAGSGARGPQLKPPAAGGSGPRRLRDDAPRPTAAGPAPIAPTPARTPDERIPSALYAHYLRLTQNEVADELAAEIVRRASDRAGTSNDPAAIRDALRSVLAEMIPVAGGIELTPGQTRRVALVGPSGAGKTSTLAKLASHFHLRESRRVALLSLDMHRVATHDEVRRYSELIGVPMESAQSVAGVRDALRRLGNPELVLIDTPGIGWRETGRFARLAALLRAAQPHETHLVLPASTAPRVQQRAAELFARLNVTRVVLSRVDELVGFGAVLATLSRLSWGVSYVSTGPRVPRQIEPACPRRLAELLCAE